MISITNKVCLWSETFVLQGNPYASIKNDAAAAAVAGAAALSGSAADMAAYQQLPAAGYYPGYDPMAAYG